MEITQETVEKVAKLACLELSEAELALYPTELTKILGFVEQLNALPLESVKGTDAASIVASPVMATVEADSPALFRQDVALHPISRDALLQNAPEVENSSFVVPNIL